MTTDQATLWSYTYHERLGSLVGTGEANDEACAMARRDADEAVRFCLGGDARRETAATNSLQVGACSEDRAAVAGKPLALPAQTSFKTPPAIYRGQALAQRFAKMREEVG